MSIKDLNLPSDCLLNSVKRGTQEIIPRGHVKLIEGDQLRIILPEKQAAQVMEEVSQLTRCQVKNGHGG